MYDDQALLDWAVSLLLARLGENQAGADPVPLRADPKEECPVKPPRPRKHDRRTFIADAVLHPASGEPPIEAYVLDISRGGFGLFSLHSLPLGSFVELEMNIRPPADDGPLPKLSGGVAYLRAGPDGNRMGISLSRPLTPDELRRLRAANRWSSLVRASPRRGRPGLAGV